MFSGMAALGGAGSTTNNNNAGGNTGADDGAALLVEMYTRSYPHADDLAEDLDDLEEGELADIVAELRAEVEVLREETTTLEHHAMALQQQQHMDGGIAGGGFNAAKKMNSLTATAAGTTGSIDTGAAAGTRGSVGAEGSTVNIVDDATDGGATATGGGSSGRRGRSYRRKSQESGDVFVSVTDKLGMLSKESEQLRQSEARARRQAEQVRGLLTATVEEARRRLKELALEYRQFARDILKINDDRGDGVDGGSSIAALSDGSIPLGELACADDLQVFLRHRQQGQASYLDKLKVQCRAAEQGIARAQLQVRQRKAAGDAFNPVDFAQLRIENEQFIERGERKSEELAELKGASTRAVQSLNGLMDALNGLGSEQAQLRKELKSRGEYLSKCAKEAVDVSVDADRAEARNKATKAQHEAVKVPKVEEYIAQTAELFELQKALKNWSRKVEIAEGQVKVIKQQTRQLNAQRESAVAYAEAKKKKRQSLAAHPRGSACGPQLAATTTNRPAPPAAAASKKAAPAPDAPLVTGAKSLLQRKRAANNAGDDKLNSDGAASASPAPESVPSPSPHGTGAAATTASTTTADAAAADGDGAEKKLAATASADGGEDDETVDGGDAANHRPRAVASTIAPMSPSRQPTEGGDADDATADDADAAKAEGAAE